MSQIEQRMTRTAEQLVPGEWHSAHTIHRKVLQSGASWSADATRGALSRLVESGRARRELRRSLVPGKPGVMAEREVWCYCPVDTSQPRL